MVEYGVIVNNKFCTLNDDENEDPDVILRRTEEAYKKEEKEAANQRRANRNALAKRKKDNAAVKAEQPVNNANKDAVGAPPLRRKQEGLKKEEANKENRAQHVGHFSIRRVRRFYGPGRGGTVLDSSNMIDDVRPHDGAVNTVPDESRGMSRGRGFRGRYRGAFRRGTFRAPGVEHDVRVDHVEGLKTMENGNDHSQVNRQFPTERTNVRRRFQRGGRGQFDRSFGEGRINNRSLDKRQDMSEKFPGGGDFEGNAGIDKKGVGASDETKEKKNSDTSSDKIQNGESAEDAGKLLTLDEFKAQLAAKRSEPQFNIRKAGEGGNEKEFGKLVPLTKQGITEGNVDEAVVVRRTPRSKRLDIEINFTDDQRSRGGVRENSRGGRENFRGGRGFRRVDGRNFRGISKQSFEVSADAFPALGEH